MASPALSPIYGELIDYLVQKATPEEILAFRLSEMAQERAESLTERNKAGTLTPEEKVELDQMLEFDQLVSLLKAKAVQALN
jgi:hypothetical protein